MSFEQNLSTWEKRYLSRHYPYRDNYSATTYVYTDLQALTLAAANSPLVCYQFGVVARLMSPANWLNVGDPIAFNPYGMQTYAREILVFCTENAWARLVSINPEYLRQVALHSADSTFLVTASMLLTETEFYLPRNTMKRFFPTYGYGIIFRADTLGGTIYMDIEGSMEGAE